MTPFRRRRRPRATWTDFDFPSSLSVSERQHRAALNAQKLRRDSRRPLAPVVIEGRDIATTFWGEAWCENLERYSDYENRLPRGRSYVRSGSVLDLQIGPGRVTSLVSGTHVYEVTIDIAAVPRDQWDAICRDLAGAIDSVVELLQGQLSKGAMARLCVRGGGLFPSPREIRFTCSCPDAAAMCKHIAAVLYGIGARFDTDPALLFTLRQARMEDLVARAETGTALTRADRGQPRKTIDPALLGDIFGLDLAPRRRPRRRT